MWDDNVRSRGFIGGAGNFCESRISCSQRCSHRQLGTLAHTHHLHRAPAIKPPPLHGRQVARLLGGLFIVNESFIRTTHHHATRCLRHCGGCGKPAHACSSSGCGGDTHTTHIRWSSGGGGRDGGVNARSFDQGKAGLHRRHWRWCDASLHRDGRPYHHRGGEEVGKVCHPFHQGAHEEAEPGGAAGVCWEEKLASATLTELYSGGGLRGGLTSPFFCTGYTACYYYDGLMY